MALDSKGITLAEVNKKYPRPFQTLGYDVLMDTDSTYKPKIISTFEMSVNSVLALLVMKPGQYPSIPDLGIDVESYLHEYADDNNIPTKIKNAIDEQCNRLRITGITIECYFDKTVDGFNALVVEINGNEQLAYGSQSNRVIIGITYDKLNRIYVKRSYI